jgi:hypothetical protein
MKTLTKLSASALLVAGLLWGGPAIAQEKPQPVARVTKISENGRLDYIRNGRTFQAYIDMKDYVHDQLKTDANTFGSIEFYTGGQIGINKNTTIEIISENKVNTINLKSGGIWSKMATQNDPLQIRTSSGVMGIKGTEFVVEETDSGTSVSVLEGQVEVTPADGGEPTQVMPGTQVLLGLKEVEVVKQGKPEDLRKQIQSSQGWKDFNEALRWASFITSYIPHAGGALGNAGYYSNMAVSLVDNPGQTLVNMAASQAGVGGYIPGGLFSSGSSKAKDPDFPSELVPDFESAATGPLPSQDLKFSWKGVKGAKKYYVIVATDENAEDVVWSGQTKETGIAYPSAAMPLEAGKYYWRVIGVDDKDKPKGKASQTWFEAAAPPEEG